MPLSKSSIPIPAPIAVGGTAPSGDWDFAGLDTQYATHSLHPYVAAMNPPLASTLIEGYFPEGATILDPFVGGGAVLVEALLSGRPSIGVDVNPLGTLIAQAKTTRIDQRRILAAGKHVLSDATERGQGQLPLIPEKVSFWFKEESLPAVAALSSAVGRLPKDDVGTLMRALLSGTVRDTMCTYRGEVRLRKLVGRDFDRFQPDPIAAFKKRLALAAERVPALPAEPASRVLLGDIRTVDLPDGCAYGVITSPPYGDDKNGVGYFQFSRYMLYWLGHELDDIKLAKDDFLGSRVNGREAPSSPTLLSALAELDERHINPRHYPEATAFYRDYDAALKRISSLVTDVIVFVVGNRSLSRTWFRNPEITVELLETHGFRLEERYARGFRKKRIANLGAEGGGLDQEAILVMRRA